MLCIISDGFDVGCVITSEASAAAAISAGIKRFGGSRIWVNCAGIGPASRVIGRRESHPLDMFAHVVDVNLVGSFNMLWLVAAQVASLHSSNRSAG